MRGVVIQAAGEPVVGRFGTAVLYTPVPEGVRDLVLAALGGPVPSAESPSATPTDAPAPDAVATAPDVAERPDDGGLLKTGVWVDPDFAPLPSESGAGAAAPDAVGPAPPPPTETPGGPEPLPGSGRRRRRTGRPAAATAPPAATTPSAATADDPAAGESAPAPEQEDGPGATQVLADAGTPLPPDAPVPLVSAAMCAAGHPNPPDALACQTCAAPLTGEIRPVPRPVLAVLTISTGQTVPVRGDLVVGRAPRPRSGDADTAELVTVPSPAHLVSRSHLEVSVAGWSLLARDLGSANGTVLVRAGIPPVLLATALPTPLLIGDVLDVGDGVTLRVEPPL